MPPDVFGSMGHYRIYQLDPSDHITAGFSLECGSDAAAMRAARTLLERSAGVEVWKSANCLAHLSPDARLLWARCGRSGWRLTSGHGCTLAQTPCRTSARQLLVSLGGRGRDVAEALNSCTPLGRTT